MCNYYSSNPTIKNTIFSGNWAEKFGGTIKNYESSPVLTNCTLSGNWAQSSGGGIWNGPGSVVKLTNCILWGNSDTDGMDESAQIDGNNEISIINYCCIQGWTGNLGGIGNIFADPLFVDAANGDYHLKSQGWRWDANERRWTKDELTSPCIDAGNPGSPLENEPLAVPEDPNNEWAINLRIDMGAYGGTGQASMPPHGASLLADLTNDGLVTMKDFAAQAQYWSPMGFSIYNFQFSIYNRQSTIENWQSSITNHQSPITNHQLPITNSMPGDLNRDGLVNALDIALLAEDWLKCRKASPSGKIYR